MFIIRVQLRQKALRFVGFFVFLSICFGNSIAQSVSGLPFVRTFHTVEYQAGIQNWAVTQDGRGIIYVANNFGLLEFDGVKWQTHNVGNGTKVRTVAVDGRGRIYVGCQGDFGYFFPDEKGQLAYTSLADSLDEKYRNFDEAWSIYIDKEKVYFCTFSRIYVYNGKSFTVAESRSPLDLSFLVNRDLLVNLRQDGLGKLKGGSLELVNGGQYFKGLGVSAILPLESDHFLVSTFQHGIYTLNKGAVKPWNESLQPFFKEAHVNCVIRLKNGNFAAGTQNDGLLILNHNGELQMQLTRGRGLENRTVLGLYEDDLHNLWVGQNNGIAHIELGSPFTFISEQSGLPGTGYAAYLDNTTFYLGTNTGLYRRTSGEKRDFELVENTRGQVYHIGRYGQDVLLGHHTGALSIRDKATFLSHEPGSWVFVLPKNNPDKLIEGTYSGLQLYVRGNDGWKFKKRLAGFDESSRVMAEDDAGNLWVTHGYKGAYRIRINLQKDSIEEVKYYGRDKGFPGNLLINVFKIRNELLFTSEEMNCCLPVSTGYFNTMHLRTCS
jgi:ligand-binding sensor domain-containing protein